MNLVKPHIKSVKRPTSKSLHFTKLQQRTDKCLDLLQTILGFLLISLMFGCKSRSNTAAIRGDRSANIEIIRDNWGIPHVYGKTDADAVFGLMYAQCEESFERVEYNYIERLGRLSEIEGEAYLYHDLQTRLIYDTSEAINDYKNAPAWLKELLHAFADGVNFYLAKNPSVQPKLLNTFQPWYALMFTDGGLTATQTGGSTLSELRALYGPGLKSTALNENRNDPRVNLDGSNAFAIAPSKSATGKAMLYINPHVNFYFRTEAHMVSEEGLNAYGAVTWGQFFVFQGFNERCGWMHTSSLADASDLYEESIVDKNGDIYYEYEDSLRKVDSKEHYFKVKTREGGQDRHVSIKTFYTHHGPVVGSRNNKWISLREENRTMNGLIQSWQRTKAKSFKEFEKSMQISANNSCNTMYADADGNIAYWHGNFVPQRDSNFDYTRPVDGKTRLTEWKPSHSPEALVYLKNPSSGWLQNCNSSPFYATTNPGLDSKKYPEYMAPDGENFRSMRAIKLLSESNKLSLDSMVAIGYDRYLAAFDSMLPPLIEAYDALKPKDSLYVFLKEPMTHLKEWNRYSDVSSIATTLAIEWGYKILDRGISLMTTEQESNQVRQFTLMTRNSPPRERLELLRDLIRDLEKIYGTWKLRWGQIVRFQRTNGEMKPSFDDNKISTPVGFSTALFGCLPAYESVFAKTYKSYGVAGNSFVAAVEFGEKVRAKSIVAGGQSYNPASPNFKDQVEMYLSGKLKDVNFYKEDVVRNKKRSYRPGE